MSFRSFTIAAACLAALTAPAFADTTVTVLHVSDNADQKAVWDKIAKDYNAEHKGVKVEFKYLENEAFKAKLPTMLQSNDSRPDLFYSWSGGVMQAQDKAGFLKDITADVGVRRIHDVPHRGRRLQGRRQSRRGAVRGGRGRLLLQQEAVRKGRGEGRGHQDLGRLPRRGQEAQSRRHHPDLGRRRREVADALLLLLPRHAHRRRTRAGRRQGRQGRRLQECDLRRGRQAPARARGARAVPARLSLDLSHPVVRHFRRRQGGDGPHGPMAARNAGTEFRERQGPAGGGHRHPVLPDRSRRQGQGDRYARRNQRVARDQDRAS